MPAAFRIIEIAFRVDLEAHGEFVKVLGYLMVAVEVFVKVHFTIAVQIVEANELVPAGDK